MSIKYVLAISVFCCVFLALINAQAQKFVDTKFRIAKAQDKNKPPVAMPFLGPESQQQDVQRNPLNVGDRGYSNPTQVPLTTTPRPQNQQQDGPLNRKKNGGSRTTPMPPNQKGNNQRNGPQLEPIFFHPRYTNIVQQFESTQYSKCTRSQGMSGCQYQESESGYQMNVLASGIPDNHKPTTMV